MGFTAENIKDNEWLVKDGAGNEYRVFLSEENNNELAAIDIVENSPTEEEGDM